MVDKNKVLPLADPGLGGVAGASARQQQNADFERFRVLVEAALEMVKAFGEYKYVTDQHYVPRSKMVLSVDVDALVQALAQLGAEATP